MAGLWKCVGLPRLPSRNPLGILYKVEFFTKNRSQPHTTLPTFSSPSLFSPLSLTFLWIYTLFANEFINKTFYYNIIFNMFKYKSKLDLDMFQITINITTHMFILFYILVFYRDYSLFVYNTLNRLLWKSIILLSIQKSVYYAGQILTYCPVPKCIIGVKEVTCGENLSQKNLWGKQNKTFEQIYYPLSNTPSVTI